ncbi:hypothetical protein TNCV_2510161 [Trichonephila clavipes]|nr:hypothetical protein TNCV_2510161 [Trichonephila clavipes]
MEESLMKLQFINEAENILLRVALQHVFEKCMNFWIHIKSFVYETPVRSTEGITGIFVAAERLRDMPGIFQKFGLAIHQNDHQARRRFLQWAQNEIAVVPDFHKRILFSDEAHFWLNGYVNKQNCRIWSEANPQVYVETPLHPEKLTV